MIVCTSNHHASEARWLLCSKKAFLNARPYFVNTHTRMRGNEDETQIVLTVPGEEDKWTTCVDAKRMVMAIIRETLRKQMATFAADLKVAILMTHTMQGMKYKLTFTGVPQSTIEEKVLLSLKDRRFAKVITSDEADQTKDEKRGNEYPHEEEPIVSRGL